MRSATLFALGLLCAGVCSVRGQSVAPPISLGPPLTEQGAAPPGTTSNAWPMAAPKASSPRGIAKNSKPPANPDGAPSSATNAALPSAASDKVSSKPGIGGPPASPDPAIDYDGFSIGTVDESDRSGRAGRRVRSRAAKASKLNVETSGLTGQESIDREDEALKRKLTICRDCR